MQPMSLLVVTGALFVGSHLALSHPLRDGLSRGLGERGFLIVYSVVAIATFLLMVQAFRGLPPEPPLWTVGDPLWIIASLLVLFASILFMGSLIGNPALPAPGAATSAQGAPRGVFAITRHPMMCALGARAWAGDADAGADGAVRNHRLPRARRIGGAGREESAADGRCVAALGGADELYPLRPAGERGDSVGRYHPARTRLVWRDSAVARGGLGAWRARLYGRGGLAAGGREAR